MHKLNFLRIQKARETPTLGQYQPRTLPRFFYSDDLGKGGGGEEHPEFRARMILTNPALNPRPPV